MEPSRRRHIEALFEAALEIEREERDRFVAAQCETDAELKGEVRALLAAHELAETLLTDVPHETPEGSRIGPYRIVREIGRGGMGIVYLAERADGQFHRQVAIKLIGVSRSDDPLYQRFVAERQILAGLDHPHIARLLDGDITTDGRPYLVLEYVDGESITDYCDRRCLDVASRLRLFLDVCSAVQHAHRKLVIHRDLKPGNILVTTRGDVRLLDFGIAKLLSPAPSVPAAPVTRAGFRIMTPEYASPEQVRGDLITTSSDIYSLGVLLYELLTGAPPYELTTASPVEALHMVCEQEPRAPSGAATRDVGRTAARARAARRGTTPDRLSRRLRGDLDAIVLMALRKDPGQRYGSADLLAQDIQRYLEGLPVTAHRARPLHRLGRFVRRHRVETVAVALVALSLLAGAGAAARQASLAHSERERAEEEQRNAEEVSRFLEGLFAAADPLAQSEERIDTLTAVQLLDRGAARVRIELGQQPRVQARLLDAVGRVYASLGRYPEARASLEEALALRSSSGDRHDQEIAESRLHLGIVLLATDQLEEARNQLERALAGFRAVHPGDDPAVAEALHHLASVDRELGEYGRAERHHREAIRILAETAGPDDSRMPRFLRELVATLEWQGKYEEAEQYARRSVDLHRRLFGARHALVAVPLRDLGLLRQRAGDYEAAEELFREAYAISLATVGRHHPQTGDLLNRLASVRGYLNDFEAADSLHRAAILLKRELYGDRHLEVAYSLNNLAWVVAQRGDVAEADSLHRAALDIAGDLVGRDHSAFFILLGARGRTLATAGDCETAEPFLRESVAGLRRTLPEAPYRAAIIEISLGACAGRAGRLREAEAILRASRDALQPRGDRDSFYQEAVAELTRLRLHQRAASRVGQADAIAASTTGSASTGD